jgi:hypothetical protein
MATIPSNPSALKRALKEALVETLHEQRGLLEEVFAEVLEEFAMAEAIRQGRKSGSVSRGTVLRTLGAKR